MKGVSGGKGEDPWLLATWPGLYSLGDSKFLNAMPGWDGGGINGGAALSCLASQEPLVGYFVREDAGEDGLSWSGPAGLF